MKISPDLCIPDRDKSLNEGAISCMGWGDSGTAGSMANNLLSSLAAHYGFSMDTPVRELPKKIMDILLYGTKGEKIAVNYESINGSGKYMTAFEGVVNALERRYRDTGSDAMKAAYEEYMSNETCPDCGGKRLKKEALAVTVGGKNIAEVSEMNIRAARAFLGGLQLNPTQTMIAAPILKEIDARIDDRVYGVLSVDASVNSRTSFGGTAPVRVRAAIVAARTAREEESR